MNPQVIGAILMIAGPVGLVIAIAIIAIRRPGRPAAEVYEERRYTEPPPWPIPDPGWARR